MSDLISRQSAIDTICTWDKFGVDERGRVVRWYEGLEPYVHLRDVVWAIERLPSAEPEHEDVDKYCRRRELMVITKELFRHMSMLAAESERKKGKWVDDVAYYDEQGCPCIVTRCNQCGEVSPISRFCPNCGADMTEREDE